MPFRPTPFTPRLTPPPPPPVVAAAAAAAAAAGVGAAHRSAKGEDESAARGDMMGEVQRDVALPSRARGCIKSNDERATGARCVGTAAAAAVLLLLKLLLLLLLLLLLQEEKEEKEEKPEGSTEGLPITWTLTLKFPLTPLMLLVSSSFVANALVVVVVVVVGVIVAARGGCGGAMPCGARSSMLNMSSQLASTLLTVIFSPSCAKSPNASSACSWRASMPAAAAASSFVALAAAAVAAIAAAVAAENDDDIIGDDVCNAAGARDASQQLASDNTA